MEWEFGAQSRLAKIWARGDWSERDRDQLWREEWLLVAVAVELTEKRSSNRNCSLGAHTELSRCDHCNSSHTLDNHLSLYPVVVIPSRQNGQYTPSTTVNTLDGRRPSPNLRVLTAIVQAIKHNNIIPNGHFHKDWQRRVKVHFEQAGRKHRRRDARIAKAARVAPRPVDRLRPIVQCPTVKYNRRSRAGRGFTLQELKVLSHHLPTHYTSSHQGAPELEHQHMNHKLVQTVYANNISFQAAGIPRKLAPTIGISVDHRRQTTSEETLKQNVQRLQSYKARLILFPRKSGQHKKLDSTPEDLKLVEDAEKISRSVGAVLPVNPGTGVDFAVSEVKKGSMPEGTKDAYVTLRKARADQRNAGMREKRAKAKADAEDSKKK